MCTVSQLRIIESEPEASLHPAAIWRHWKKYVIWDPRSYYGLLEFSMVLVCLRSSQEATHSGTLADIQRLCNAALLLFTIAILHWYSTYRSSQHFLTRSLSHFIILVTLGIITFASQLSSNLIYKSRCTRGFYDVDCHFPSILLWVSIPIIFFVAYLIYTVARNPPRDPLLAELPSPVDTDYEQSRVPWARVNVADGIEDDSPILEGQVRL